MKLKKPQIIYTTFGKLLSSDDQLLDYFNSTQDAALNISEGESFLGKDLTLKANCDEVFIPCTQKVLANKSFVDTEAVAQLKT
ncbi:hypothetical protein HK099_002059, partial [Clydaea vesicula]